MRFLVLAVALLPAAALAKDLSADTGSAAVAPAPAVKAAKTPAEKQCDNARPQLANAPSQAMLARPLSQEPRANRYLPVLRMIDGCDKPVMVGEHRESGH